MWRRQAARARRDAAPLTVGPPFLQVMEAYCQTEPLPWYATERSPMIDSATPAPGQQQESLDAWSLLGLPGPLSAASFLTGQRAHQYRLIVDILAERQTQSLTGVGRDELADLLGRRLPPDTAQDLLPSLNLDERLGQLVAWGTCEAWQDPATTEADFLRNRFRYQLTEAGAELHRTALRIETEAGVGSTAALMAPASLAERLEATLHALRAGDTTAASGAYSQVQTTLENMAASASTWQSKLAAALGGAPEEVKVTRLLETILAYVEAWGSGIDAYTARIADTLPTLRSLENDTWRALALARVQANAPEHTVAGAIDELRGVVTTLELWFSGQVPQAQLLRRQMRDAVAPVLRSHRTLLAVGGTVSRRAELLKLARGLEAAAGGYRLAALGVGDRVVLGAPPAARGTRNRPSPAHLRLGRPTCSGLAPAAHPGPPVGGRTHRADRGHGSSPDGGPSPSRQGPRGSCSCRGCTRGPVGHPPVRVGPLGRRSDRSLPPPRLGRPQPPRPRRQPDRPQRGRPLAPRAAPGRPAGVRRPPHPRGPPRRARRTGGDRPMTTLSFRAVDLADKQTAFTGLLACPLVAPWVDPGLYALVTRHEHDLETWAARLGYRLLRIDSCLRLRRPPVGGVPALPAGKAPRRRPLVLALVVAAALEDQRGDSVTLQELSDAVRRASALHGLAPYDPNQRGHRADLLTAVQLLGTYGVLEQRTHRSDLVTSWEREGAGIGAGYLIHRDAMVLLVDTRDVGQALAPEPATPDTRGARLLRTLLECQALYPLELAESDRAYLQSQRGRLIAQAEEMTGGTVEVRADALVLVLPTDRGLAAALFVDFPAATAADWVALSLLDGAIAASEPDAVTGRRRCPSATVASLATTLHAAQRSRLTVALRESPAAVRTAAEQQLEGASLLSVTPDGDWVLLPAAGRYRDAELNTISAPPDPTLLEEEPYP